MPMNGGSVPAFIAGGDLPRRRFRVAVLLRIRARAVAVLEVETIVFNRFPLELVDDAGAHGFGEAWIAGGQSENPARTPVPSARTC